MTGAKQKTIGIFLPDDFADWEFGFLAGAAVEHFDANIVFITIGAQPVRSIGGLVTTGARVADVAANTDLDALALIGSDKWKAPVPPDISALAKDVLMRGGVVGGICAATVGLARAGLFDGRKHTSNGREWIEREAGNYAGSDGYVDTSSAVSDGHIVTAPGTAPVSFAMNFLAEVFPESAEMLVGARAVFGAEHSAWR